MNVHTHHYTALVRALAQDAARVEATLSEMELRLAHVPPRPVKEDADVAAWRDRVQALRTLLYGLHVSLAVRREETREGGAA